MNNKKTIGLLSLSNAENYGAVLQCYSLLKKCKELAGKDKVQVINYFPPFMRGRYKLFWIDKESTKSLLSSLKYSIECLPFTLTKKMRFIRFRTKYLNINPFEKKSKINDEFDKYIVGSDQVWNLNITEHDMAFFLDFVMDNKKKNSYAASIGVDGYQSEDEILLKQSIKFFDNISVREKDATNYIKGICDNEKYIYNHIDPVFLTDADDWRKIASTSRIKIKNPYVLIYSFESVELAFKIARKFTVKQNLNIVVIRADKIKKIHEASCCRSVGPCEFLYLIDNASLVVTDSFHGTAFSIIFNKQFYSIPFNGTNSRISNILDIFGFLNRLVSSQDQCSCEDIVDYKDYDITLKQQIDSSTNYLKHIISEG